MKLVVIVSNKQSKFLVIQESSQIVFKKGVLAKVFSFFIRKIESSIFTCYINSILWHQYFNNTYIYMWRGPVVQARKNAVNAVKWKVFSMHAKLIAIAAQKWGNPDDNPSLASLISKAKKEWVPNDTIERAIKKWTGEDKDAAQITEIIYEWYAPGWIALLISTLTDNKNRTVSNVRSIFSKYGWNMWESGAVSWMFHSKWVLFIEKLRILNSKHDT